MIPGRVCSNSDILKKRLPAFLIISRVSVRMDYMEERWRPTKNRGGYFSLAAHLVRRLVDGNWRPASGRASANSSIRTEGIVGELISGPNVGSSGTAMRTSSFLFKRTMVGGGLNAVMDG